MVWMNLFSGQEKRCTEIGNGLLYTEGEGGGDPPPGGVGRGGLAAGCWLPADFSPMVQSDMSKSPPTAAAVVAQEIQMELLENAAPAGALGAAAQVARAPRPPLPL